MVHARTSSDGALGRSRSAIIAGARLVVAGVGIRRTTMAAVARRAGVSKATLYNHVRDKDDLLLLLIADGCQRAAVAADVAGPAASDRLAAAARVIADDEVLIALRAHESAALVPLLLLGDNPMWTPVRGQVQDLLTSAGLGADPDSVELALRWLLSYVLTPGDSVSRERGARRISLALASGATLQAVSAFVVTDTHTWTEGPSLTA